MISIDAERLLADLRELRSFGARGTGVVRPAFSEVDNRSRRWLVEKFAQAGLDAAIDGIGNVFGRSQNPGTAVLVGSHSDTQPTGGWLDGALGVIYGLECARALGECDETQHLAVDAVSWMDEEGAYFTCLGSSSFCQFVSLDDIANTEAHGRSLSQAIIDAGLDGVARVHLENQRYAGYLEAHIEQGPRLEAAEKHIGVVTAIVGIRDLKIGFTGAQNHAGTTPMALRHDAGRALIDTAGQIDRMFSQVFGEDSIRTIGQVEFQPGAPSIIPGQARMTLQFRDSDSSRLDAMEDEIRTLVAAANDNGRVAVSITPSDDRVAPATMDETLQEAVAAAAEQHAPGAWMRMPSGAGHDAQVLARRLPSAMLFVPSIGGVSHDFAEDTLDDDIVLGCRVFTTAVARILQANTG